jgi:hypothetical protein
MTIPGLSEAHPMHAHLARAVDPAVETAAPAGGPAEFLDAHQLETTAILGERILPGAGKLQVERFIDQLLAVDTVENRERFLVALGAMEGEAIGRFRRPFKSLSAAEQDEVLTAASTAKPGREEKHWTPGTPAVTRPAPAAPTTLRDHFDHIKGWIVGAYYSTEAGMRELGWTGQQFFESFPGCPHPDGHR